MKQALIVAFGAATALAAHDTGKFGTNSNKFGIGVYGDGDGGSSLTVADQLPWASDLVGQGGRVLLYVGMSFSQNGNVSSCRSGCVPSERDVATIQQAYAMGLRPVVRLGQWPRTIRDFSDDEAHAVYTSLAGAYRTFAEALPLPPDGSPLEVIVLNEPNGPAEWQCSGSGSVSQKDTASEVAGCLRDMLAALRPLPRLRLSPAPTAYTQPATYPCHDSGDKPGPVDWGVPTDIDFMHRMFQAVPDLYANADFFNSHPYPFGGKSFSEPLGRAGAVHYRTQLNATGRPSLPVLISEAGWKGHNETDKASSVVAAFKEEWLPDTRVESVMPFLLSGDAGSMFVEDGWQWVAWPNTSAGVPAPTLQYNATRALRCGLHIGGPCDSLFV